MILSKHAFVKIAPVNYYYWQEKGYDTGKTGGRAGTNGNKRIRVRVVDLAEKSNINIAIKCDDCGKKFISRYARRKDTCEECRVKVIHQNMRGNTFGKKHDEDLIPSREDLLKFVGEGRGCKTAIANHYNTTPMIVTRWLKDRGIDNLLKVRKIPNDFRDYYLNQNPSKTEIEKKYSVSRPMVNRWIKELELPYKGITNKIEMPSLEEMIKLNETLDTEQLAEYYNVSNSKIVVWFRENNVTLKNHGFGGTSEEEKEFIDFLNSVVPGFIQSKKNIFDNRKIELDAYHPDLNIAFEYDGIYWHSYKGANEHRNKWDLCFNKGITLYRINSHEWNYKKDLVKSMIKARLGKTENKLYARNLIVKEIGQNKAKDYHSQNHISNYGGISPVNIGLFDNDNLVSVMSFSKNRYSVKCEWEISRFSSNMNYIIIGAAGKIFSYFVKNYNPESVLTFSDLRWGTGKVYEKLGFKRIKRGPPTYWYYHQKFPEERFHRMLFQKKKLAAKLENFDPNLTEVENMRNNKYYQYWDCGSDHFVWTKKEAPIGASILV